MFKEDIKLTKDPVKNIQTMAPYLTEKEQYMVMGMLLAGRTEPKNKKTLEPKKTG